MNNYRPFLPKKFNLSGLNGISDQTLEMHFKLYESYVDATNEMRDRISDYAKDLRDEAGKKPEYSELKRRLDFEYYGMILHECYFTSMKKGGGGEPERNSAFRKAVERSFGSYNLWKKDFMIAAKTRGLGWQVCCQNPANYRISNRWITLREIHEVAGIIPLLVMDVWEQAYILDYKPSERDKYVNAFFSNIDWSAVESRVTNPEQTRDQKQAGIPIEPMTTVLSPG